MTIDASHFDGDVIWIFYSCAISNMAWISDNEDGTYTIFLPSGVDEERRMKLALHELEHLKRGDLHAQGDVREIEKRIMNEKHTLGSN